MLRFVRTETACLGGITERLKKNEKTKSLDLNLIEMYCPDLKYAGQDPKTFSVDEKKQLPKEEGPKFI